VQAVIERLANEPFALERALPLRVRLLAEGPGTVLVFSLHHVVCDGRGMIQILESLMAHLNGRGGEVVPLDHPSMIPALLPGSTFARLRSLWRSYWLQRRERKAVRGFRTISAGHEAGEFGPAGVRLHTVPVGLEAIKASARARDCTVTELVVAVLSASFARTSKQDGRNAAGVRLSVDLRPYFAEGRRPRFGNYVASFMVHISRWDDLEGAISDVRAQVRERLARFERKEMSYPLLMAELPPLLLGRRLLGRAAAALKRRGKLQPITFHYSSLGSVDGLNGQGDRAQVAELNFFTLAVGPYIGCVGMGNRLHLGITYPRREISDQAMAEILTDFDQRLARLVAGEESRNASA
jgi:NRPS condensation-like uncharacterized protein